MNWVLVKSWPKLNCVLIIPYILISVRAGRYNRDKVGITRDIESRLTLEIITRIPPRHPTHFPKLITDSDIPTICSPFAMCWCCSTGNSFSQSYCMRRWWRRRVGEEEERKMSISEGTKKKKNIITYVSMGWSQMPKNTNKNAKMLAKSWKNAHFKQIFLCKKSTKTALLKFNINKIYSILIL